MNNKNKILKSCMNNRASQKMISFSTKKNSTTKM